MDMDLTNHTFAILNQSNIFIELREVSYDGNLYYYDPRDDDIWPVERFVRELHGQTAKIEDHLYYADGTDGKWNRFVMKV
jgi:hypothetical protein